MDSRSLRDKSFDYAQDKQVIRTSGKTGDGRWMREDGRRIRKKYPISNFQCPISK
jgi:hypothetical protein